jgi:hypothetical protein
MIENYFGDKLTPRRCAREILARVLSKTCAEWVSENYTNLHRSRMEESEINEISRNLIWLCNRTAKKILGKEYCTVDGVEIEPLKGEDIFITICPAAGNYYAIAEHKPSETKVYGPTCKSADEAKRTALARLEQAYEDWFWFNLPNWYEVDRAKTRVRRQFAGVAGMRRKQERDCSASFCES